MRKRAQTQTNEQDIVPKSINKAPAKQKPKSTISKISKNQWMTGALVGIFVLVLILNSFFIVSSGAPFNPDGTDVSDTYYLSGPDPYYNMRLVEETLETGQYPFYGSDDPDPLLNYGLGRSGNRAPLMNMMAIGLSRVMMPFVGETAGVGIAMQFLPALFGALLVFPVYYLGKELFGEKEGLIAALLIALIPIHLGSGHGSAYGLFDHDSFNLFFFATTFFFLVKTVKTKDTVKARLFAVLGGLSFAAITMTWVEARFIYTAVAVYVVVQFIVDVVSNKLDKQWAMNMPIMFFTGYLVSLPVLIAKNGFSFNFILMACLGVLAISAIYLLLIKLDIPWVISLPGLGVLAAGALVFLYFSPSLLEISSVFQPFTKAAEIIFGSGIYGNKVSLTIAEAGTYSVSRSVMSFGPAVYWMAWAAFVVVLVWFLKNRDRKDLLFLMTIFLIDIWLTSTAGRFLNDLVPIIAVLSGFFIWFIISKVNYKDMIKTFRMSGGGVHGIRRAVKIYHVLGVLFIAVLVVMPNVYLSLDAAIPSVAVENDDGEYESLKTVYFGADHEAAFGSSYYKEEYWVDALSWLAQQDTEILDDVDRPGVISWWDYGFYESAVGDHPTVADNFQDGIPPASNFHTATSEQAGVAVFIIRILESNAKQNDGTISSNVKDVLTEHLGTNGSVVAGWIEDPTTSPSYHATIGEEYDDDLADDHLIGEQYEANAFYQDIMAMVEENLDDEEVTQLYHDVQEATGLSIRYYAVEGYDEQIFNIFAFLSDRSNVLYALQESTLNKYYNPEDDFMTVSYVGYYYNTDGSTGSEQTWTAAELNALAESQRSRISISSTNQELKDAYYNTMFYRTYIGDIPSQLSNYFPQLPTWGMDHFYAEYVSDIAYSNYRLAVVMAKYYEGAFINGTVLYEGAPMTDLQVTITDPIDMYGTPVLIDHASADLDENGTFNVLAGAGNITLQIRRYPELGPSAFLMESITFNEAGERAEITDAEAMRLVDTYTRALGDIEINHSALKGYIYTDSDQSGAYEVENDTAMQGVKITIAEILEFDSSGIPQSTATPIELERTSDDGYYAAEKLRPGIYTIEANLDGVIVYSDYLFLAQGVEWINISEPIQSSIEGTAYSDENENGAFDYGEEISAGEITAELIYNSYDGTEMLIQDVELDSASYSFTDLYPGNYTVRVWQNLSSSDYKDFYGDRTFDLDENVTLSMNLSMTLAPVTVYGYTLNEEDPVGEVSVTFEPDGTVENNTAVATSATVDEAGKYTLPVIPGKYNVTVDSTVDDGVFTFEGKLSVNRGEGTKRYNVDMEKLSYQLAGTVSAGSEKKADIEIEFIPDSDVDNNTAVYNYVTSDSSGIFTIELMPGTYEVSVNQTVNESGVDVQYTYETSLTVVDADLSLPIMLTREEL